MAKKAKIEKFDEDLEADPEIEVEEDISTFPVGADPLETIDRKIPKDLLDKYDVYSYKNAAVILTEVWKNEFAEICEALRKFSITTAMIRKAGGNESDMPREFSKTLRPLGWHETSIRADLNVTLSWREPTGKLTKKGKPVMVAASREIKRDRYFDGRKIDYVKRSVAVDLECNRKDQTLDRDLYAFMAPSLQRHHICNTLIKPIISTLLIGK